MPLTPEQQTRLAELPPLARDQVLTWLAMGDLILRREARKMLAPARASLSPLRHSPRRSSESVRILRIPNLVADWLATTFDDRKTYRGFLARCPRRGVGDYRPVLPLGVPSGDGSEGEETRPSSCSH